MIRRRALSLRVLTVAGAAAAALLLAGCGDDDFVPPPAVSRITSDLEGPTWVLDPAEVEAAGVTGVVPTIRFLAGQVTGTTGCNSFRGTYTLDGTNLTLSPLATTLIGCQPPLDELEQEILGQLATVTAYRIEGSQLQLLAGDEVALTYIANEPDLVGSWAVTGILADDAFRSVVGDVTLTADFGADGTVTGTGGCNRFTSGYTAEGQSIAIGPIASTRVACADEELTAQETAYFAALEEATRWEQVGDELSLFNEAGQLTVSFQRA